MMAARRHLDPLIGRQLVPGRCQPPHRKGPGGDASLVAAPMANSPKLLRYPDRGRLLVAADLHGNLRDFLTIVARFEGMGDDAHLLFLGDLLHGPLLEPAAWPKMPTEPSLLHGRPYRDESPAIILGLQLLAERHPGRVLSLLGNHEHAHIGGPRTAVFARDEAGALEQRLGLENSVWLAGYLKSLPLWAIAPCGVLFSHAAPAAELTSLGELEAIDYRRYATAKGGDARSRAAKPAKPGEAAARLLGQLLWERALPPFKAQALLGVAGAQMVVYGHAVIPTGYQTIGYEQLILSSSFAMEDEHKKVLELDLSATYLTVEDLRPGTEILPLY